VSPTRVCELAVPVQRDHPASPPVDESDVIQVLFGMDWETP
jgi:hypothetical protein